ncbi:hypothetical protein FJZ31_43070 [Candidatus Poribacteria bacterium]|nr:hypothetical protein [Candidatus Poribacteria bacterium]
MTNQITRLEPAIGLLVLNDDGHVFLNLSDDLQESDLRRYLESYCRSGVSTVAYCVGDMSWPTLYPTRVGQQRTSPVVGGDNLRQRRAYQNVKNFAAQPGGYFGAVFAILHELGKKVLASFRMNDAHFTTSDNPNVSEFWKQHVKLTLGSGYGYYGGCLNYASDVVRTHFFDRVVEFVDLYPELDGIELDAMRSPFFFPPGQGREHAPRFTELVRDIKMALAAQAKRLKRPEYLLSINVPLTPELAPECGLDVAVWDAEGLFDAVSVGTYQAYMNHPLEQWKELLVQGTPVLAYVNCSPQTGQYLGLEEYRAAAANAHASSADGIYLFNYPCLFELAMQMPLPTEAVKTELPDLRAFGHPDLTKVGRALDELGRAELLRGKDKRFLFYFSKNVDYRHHDPDQASLVRPADDGQLTASFRCYEDYDRAHAITLRFKLENVRGDEQFQASLNGQPVNARQQQVRYAANGRDTRLHTVTLGPYLEYDITLQPSQLRKGENRLQVTPTRLAPELTTTINLLEIELLVSYEALAREEKGETAEQEMR